MKYFMAQNLSFDFCCTCQQMYLYDLNYYFLYSRIQHRWIVCTWVFRWYFVKIDIWFSLFIENCVKCAQNDHCLADKKLRQTKWVSHNVYYSVHEWMKNSKPTFKWAEIHNSFSLLRRALWLLPFQCSHFDCVNFFIIILDYLFTINSLPCASACACVCLNAHCHVSICVSVFNFSVFSNSPFLLMWIHSNCFVENKERIYFSNPKLS